MFAGVHTEVYTKIHKILNSIARLDLRGLSVPKYRALLMFILDEIEADVEGKATCFSFDVESNSLTFKLLKHEF